MEWKPYQHNAKYYETDQMGIVHHSNYIRWFEEARIDWMKQVGLDYRAMEERGIIIPVVGVQAVYHAMTRFDDTVQITTRLESYTGVRFSFSYEVRDAHSGALRVTGRTDHCFIDAEDRPFPLKKRAPDLDACFRKLAGMGRPADRK